MATRTRDSRQVDACFYDGASNRRRGSWSFSFSKQAAVLQFAPTMLAVVLHRRNRCDFNPRQLPDDEDETRRRPAKQGNEAADTLCSDADDREVDSSFPAWKPSLITSY